MRSLLTILAVCFLLAAGLVARAQESAVLNLSSPTLNLQTGQEYEIAIRVDNAPDFWTTDVALDYDSAFIYVIGTSAGSPVTTGELFTSVSSVVVQNLVQDSQISYVISKVGETTPASGSGVIGTFRIYPVAPGQTQITFSRAQLVGLTSYDPNATDVSTVSIPATVVLLDLTISGDPVEPPSEATATPQPTETATPFGGIGVQVNQQPTVVNVTAAPLATLSAPGETAAASTPLPLILAVIVMLVGGIGLVIVFIRWRQSRR